MPYIDKLSNRPVVYNKIIAYLLEEHYDIHKSLATFRNKRYIYSTFHTLLHYPRDCYIMLDDSQETLIGTCVIIYGNLASIFIFPEYRHKGYAKMLLEHVKKEHKDLLLWTYNPKFIPYYENLGYSIKKIIQEPTVITYLFCNQKARL
jgi:GNAT superfamily N-acetyltransferase